MLCWHFYSLPETVINIISMACFLLKKFFFKSAFAYYSSFIISGRKGQTVCVRAYTMLGNNLMNTIMYTILLNSELVVNSIIYREQINWHIYLSTFVPQVCYVQSTWPIHLLGKLRYRQHGLHCVCWHCRLSRPSIKMLTGCPRDVWQGLKMS